MWSTVATAHSSSIPPSGFDFLPLIGAVAAVTLVRLVCRRLTGWSVTGAAAAGTVWAWWVEAVGFSLQPPHPDEAS